MTKPYMITHSGKKIVFTDPCPLSIDLHDIAHSLARTARFNGHTAGNRAYSVVQHSVLVSHQVPPEFALHGLLHDASEAYTGDISTPYKEILGEAHARVEERLMEVISMVFGFERSREAQAAVKKADLTLLATEIAQLRHSPDSFSALPYPALPSILRTVWSARKATKRFLWRFREIQKS